MNEDLSIYHTPLPLTTLHLSWAAPFVLNVTLNRPEVRNAISDAFWAEFKQVFETVAEDGNVRCIIVSGNGPLFCAGIDLKARGNRVAPKDQGRKMFNHRRRVMITSVAAFQAMEYCEKPIISVAHGATFGAGIELLCVTDVRYCTKDATFNLKEVDIATAADVGALQRLPKICGSDSFVRELAFSARFFDAKEALQFGFVNRVFDNKDGAMAAALDMAKLIASKSPVAVTATKDILNYSRDKSVEDGLKYNAIYVSGIHGSEDGQRVNEGMSKKTTPVFSKL